MKILGIGESVIDNVYLINNPDKADQETVEMSPQKHIGGPVLTALILLSRLGADTTMLTSLGRDEDANIIKRTLKHEKITVIGKIQKQTKVHTIYINKHTGQRQKLRGNHLHIPIKDIDRKFIRQFDLILIDRHEKQAFYEIIAKKKITTQVVIDPSTEVSTFTLDMIRLSEYPIIPIETLTKMKQGCDLSRCIQSIYELSQKTVIITAGELGSLIYDGKHLDIIPSFNITPIDTTGAGDIYRGGFAYGILQKWEINKCARFANLVAGMQCTKIGNAAAIPTIQEIHKYAKIVQNKPISMPNINTYFSQLHQTL